jgi:hypothetical protein
VHNQLGLGDEYEKTAIITGYIKRQKGKVDGKKKKKILLELVMTGINLFILHIL